MATIKDIARRTGLGLATISKYLNGGHVLDKNREAIEAAIQDLDYTVNAFGRGLKTKRSRTIGVVIPELSNLFVTTIITAMEDVLRGQGYGALICDCRTDGDREADAVRFLMGKQVDGIVNMPVAGDGNHLLPALDGGIPVVLVDRMVPSLAGRVSAVLVDNVAAAETGVNALLDAGHTGIGIIAGPRELFTARQRLLGYRQALTKRGIQPDEEHVVHSDYTVEGGYEAMKRLLAVSGVTAVFVTNYEMTLGAVIAANELGVQVPAEISLIGFDNLHLSRVIRPRLSIITQPLAEIGTAAADILLRRLAPERDEGPAVVTLPTGYLPGESVGRCRPRADLGRCPNPQTF